MADFRSFLNNADKRQRLRENVAEINRLYKVAMEEGHESLSLFTSFRKMFAQVSGGEPKDFEKIIKLGKAANRKKNQDDLLALTERFLKSEWATPEGRERIWQKTFTKTRERKGISRRVWLRSVDILNNDIFQQLIELAGFSSDQVYEMISEETRYNAGRRRRHSEEVSLEDALQYIYDNLAKIRHRPLEVSDVLVAFKKVARQRGKT